VTIRPLASPGDLAVPRGSRIAREAHMTAVDPEYQRHRQTWLGFTRFIKIALAVIIVILVGMAIFLV
jgi:hypothetical protein